MTMLSLCYRPIVLGSVHASPQGENCDRWWYDAIRRNCSFASHPLCRAQRFSYSQTYSVWLNGKELSTKKSVAGAKQTAVDATVADASAAAGVGGVADFPWREDPAGFLYTAWYAALHDHQLHGKSGSELARRHPRAILPPYSPLSFKPKCSGVPSGFKRFEGYHGKGLRRGDVGCEVIPDWVAREERRGANFATVGVVSLPYPSVVVWNERDR